MDSPFDPPAGPDFRPPLLKEAFGWETDPDVPASFKLGMANAADTLATLRGKISDALASQWANSAVTADLLSGKIASHLGGTMDSIQAATAALQQPIATANVSALGQAFELSSKLGALLPVPETIGQEAPCVAIRAAGLQGDVSVAVDGYRRLAWPQRFTKGANYVSVIQWIQGCLPNDPAIQDAFAAQVSQLETLPDAVPFPIPQLAAGVGGSVTVNTEVACGPPPPSRSGDPPWVCVAGKWIRQDTVGAGSQPGGQSTSATGIAGQCGATGLCAGPSVDCAIVSQLTPGQLVTLSQPGGTIRLDPSLNGGRELALVRNGPDVTGHGWFLIQEIVRRGGEFEVFVLNQCPWPLDQQQMEQQQQATQQQTTTCPPPPSCPPPPCIKICPTDTVPPPPPPPCSYDLVCSASGVMYFRPTVTQSSTGTQQTVSQTNVRKEIPPPASNLFSAGESGDTIIASGDPAKMDIAALYRRCLNRQQETQTVQTILWTPPQIGDVAAECADFGSVPTANNVVDVDAFLQWLGIQQPDGTATQPFPNSGFGNIGATIINGLVTYFETLLIQGFDVVGALLNAGGCASGSQIGLVTSGVLLEFFGGFVGSALDVARMPNRQARQFNCPTLLPSAGQAGAAWLAGEIDENTLTCWVRADNYRNAEYASVIKAGRAKVGAGQLALMLQREIIDRSTYDTQIRANGYIEGGEAQAFVELSKPIPSLGAVVGYASSLANDDGVAGRFQLDEGLQDLSAGSLADWTRKSGYDPVELEMAWRAHWTDPGVGQLTELLQRSAALAVDDPAYLSEEMFRESLERSTLAPVWYDKIASLARRPLEFRQIKLAYQEGALDFDGMLQSIRGLGYSQTDALTLAETERRQWNEKWQNHWTTHAYAEGTLNDADLETILTAAGARPEDVEQVKFRAQNYAQQATRKACIARVKKKYMMGLATLPAALEALNGFGVSPQQVNNLSSSWRCEFNSQGKDLGASDLCRLYEEGAIDVVTLTQGFLNLGYAYDNAILLARSCVKRTADKLSKEQQRQLKELQQQEKQAEAAANRQSADAARQARQAQAAAQKAQATQLARTKRLIEAGGNFHENSGMSLPDAVLNVQAVYTGLVSSTMWTRDEIIVALLAVSKDKAAFDLSTLTEETRKVLLA